MNIKAITRPASTGSRSLGLAIGWGACFALGTALMTWSGRYYVAMPLWFVLVAGAGFLGGAIGRWLALSSLPRTEATICAALFAPVLIGLRTRQPRRSGRRPIRSRTVGRGEDLPRQLPRRNRVHQSRKARSADQPRQRDHHPPQH